MAEFTSFGDEAETQHEQNESAQQRQRRLGCIWRWLPLFYIVGVAASVTVGAALVPTDASLNPYIVLVYSLCIGPAIAVPCMFTAAVALVIGLDFCCGCEVCPVGPAADRGDDAADGPPAHEFRPLLVLVEDQPDADSLLLHGFTVPPQQQQTWHPETPRPPPINPAFFV